MSYTVKTSDPDPEFLNAGKKNGVLVWRIENFTVKKVNPNDYGKFYTGDSYIVLNTNIEKNILNIHYWLGSESSIDEYGTCALKAIELDDYLGGRPVQYREVQFYESSLFLALFEQKGLRYLSGGCPSGFKDSKAESEKVAKLYMVKGKKDIRIVEVAFRIDSLNKSDVFILDDNKTIYQWNGPGANRMEQLKATIFAKRIRDDDHSGKCDLIVIDSEDWNKCSDFWKLLPGDKDSIKNESDVADVEFERSFNSSQIALYKVSDENKNCEASIELIHNGKLSRTMLDSKDCFIVDCNTKGIYCWIGKECTKKEKVATVNGSKELMVKQNYPNYIPLETVVDGGESIAFKSLFKDWNNQL